MYQVIKSKSSRRIGVSRAKRALFVILDNTDDIVMLDGREIEFSKQIDTVNEYLTAEHPDMTVLWQFRNIFYCSVKK